MKHLSHFILLTMGMVVASSTLANPLLRMVTVNPLSSRHPFFSLAGGASQTSSGSSSANYPVLNPITDQFYNYTSASNSRNPGVLEGFMGEEFVLGTWLLQVGFAYNQSGNFIFNGGLTQGADECSVDNFTYNYAVMARQLTAQTRILYQLNTRVYPYLLFAAGVNVNKAYSFKTNIPVGLALTRDYSENWKSSLGYIMGGGIDIALNDFIRIGVGYRFVDFGTVKLGKATLNTVNFATTLPSFNLYAQELVGEISFV